jgi:hypothetical protein
MPGKANLPLIKRDGVNVLQVKVHPVGSGCIGSFPMAASGTNAGNQLPGLKLVKVKLSLLLPVKIVHRFIINTTLSVNHLHCLPIYLQKDEQKTD